MTVEVNPEVSLRLQNEHVIWLTSVRQDGTPQPTPVWFLWDGETFLIYSQPDTKKIRNIEKNPRVALNLNSDEQGGNVLVLTGEAVIDPQTPAGDQVPAYLEKYREGIAEIGMTPDSFARSYSVPIRVRPASLRAEH